MTEAPVQNRGWPRRRVLCCVLLVGLIGTIIQLRRTYPDWAIHVIFKPEIAVHRVWDPPQPPMYFVEHQNSLPLLLGDDMIVEEIDQSQYEAYKAEGTPMSSIPGSNYLDHRVRLRD